MINLHVSDAARQKIASIMAKEIERDLLAAFAWTDAADGREGAWIFGFYARDRISPKDIELVDGIEFVIAGPPLYVPLLNGKRLDMLGDQFVLVTD